jgi:hypothetical protein
MNRSPRAVRTLPVLAALLAALLLLPLAGCGGEGPPPPPPDGGMQPISSSDGTGAPGAPAGAPGAAAGGIQWDWPAGWQQQAPSSSMRAAQAVIPGEAGPADFVVFHFGVGQGGGTEANVDRWIGQMQDHGEPQRDEFDVGGYHVTWVEVGGTLMPSTMGTGPTEPQPESHLIGAVVEGEGGPWFFKVTGPGATVLDARDEVRGVLESLEPV